MLPEINTGTPGLANSGDTLYAGGEKINSAFQDIWSAFSRNSLADADKTLHAAGCYQLLTQGDYTNIAASVTSPDYNPLAIDAVVYNTEPGDMVWVQEPWDAGSKPAIIRLPNAMTGDVVRIRTRADVSTAAVYVAVTDEVAESINGITSGGNPVSYIKLPDNAEAEFVCIFSDQPNTSSAVWSVNIKTQFVRPRIEIGTEVTGILANAPTPVYIPKNYLTAGSLKVVMKYSVLAVAHVASSMLHLVHNNTTVNYEESALLSTEENLLGSTGIKPYDIVPSISGSDLVLTFTPDYDCDLYILPIATLV